MTVDSVFLRRSLLVCVMALAWGPPAANAQGQEDLALARELVSPFCPGLRLSDCQSSRAGELRAEIRGRLEAGEPQAAIVDDLVARFGPDILGRPDMHGIGVMAWAVPFSLGAATLFMLAWRLRRPAAGDADPNGQPSGTEDPLTAVRLDAELHAMD